MVYMLVFIAPGVSALHSHAWLKLQQNPVPGRYVTPESSSGFTHSIPSWVCLCVYACVCVWWWWWWGIEIA